MSLWCLYPTQQAQAGKVAHLLNVCFWDASDNGFRESDSVPNNNAVLAHESNLAEFVGMIRRFQICQYTGLKTKQTRAEWGKKLSCEVASFYTWFYTCPFPPPNLSFNATVDWNLFCSQLGPQHLLLLKHMNTIPHTHGQCLWKFQAPHDLWGITFPQALL